MTNRAAYFSKMFTVMDRENKRGREKKRERYKE